MFDNPTKPTREPDCAGESWRCQACGARLRNSLEIWAHLGEITPAEDLKVPTPGPQCGKERIAFECKAHGEERA